LPKEKSEGLFFFGMGGPSKQHTQISDLKKLLEAKDSEIHEYNSRIHEMWNQMNIRYPFLYQVQQQDNRLEAL